MNTRIQRYNKVCQTLREQLVPKPAPNDIFVGDGDYVEISLEYLRYFIEVGRLEPTDSVLDVGSGIGRMALSLAHYLDPEEGRYLGLDPVKRGISWCQKNITSKFPNCHFYHLDAFHEIYNTSGKLSASAISFPVKDQAIDFIIATSVFSHLYEEDILNYLKEMGRMLSEKGRIFCTAYLFEGATPPQDIHIDHLRFSLQPSLPRQSYHVLGYPPLAAVAFAEDYFRDMIDSIPNRRAVVFPGRWRGATGPWFQDVILIE